MYRYRFFRCAAILATLPFAISAHAQNGVLAPGRIEQDTRPPPEPVVRPPVVITRPLFPEQVPAGAEVASFILGSVKLSGNAALSSEALAPLWAGRLGGRITLAEAFAIAAAISARYREAGYVLSQAVVPAQELNTTAPVALRIEVLEGYVDHVSFTGIDGSRLEGFVQPVLAERPLKLVTLERSLLLISELAGITAQANVKAGGASNASDLEIVVARVPREYSLSVHNRSAPVQGRFRFEAGASFRGLVGAFDRHDLRLITSGDDRLNLLAYATQAPLGSNGLTAQLAISASRSKPTSMVTNIDTRSDNASITFNYPVLRSRQTNLGLRASFGGYDDSADTPARTSQDRIRAIRVGLSADHLDAFGGITLLDVELAKGLSALGASSADEPLLLGARPDFTKLTLYAARLQSLGGDWSALLAASAQASNDKLPTAEQLGLGGDTFLRAYDPSEVIGENGAAGKFELRFNRTFAAVASTFYAYFDAGQVRRRQVAAPTQTYTLTATGLGLRFSAPLRTRGYVEVAKPLNRAVASQGDKSVRVFAGLGIDF